MAFIKLLLISILVLFVMQRGVDALSRKALLNDNDKVIWKNPHFPHLTTPYFNNNPLRLNKDYPGHRFLHSNRHLTSTSSYESPAPAPAPLQESSSKFCYASGACSCTTDNDCLCTGVAPGFCTLRNLPIASRTFAPAHAPTTHQ